MKIDLARLQPESQHTIKLDSCDCGPCREGQVKPHHLKVRRKLVDIQVVDVPSDAPQTMVVVATAQLQHPMGVLSVECIGKVTTDGKFGDHMQWWQAMPARSTQAAVPVAPAPAPVAPAYKTISLNFTVPSDIDVDSGTLARIKDLLLEGLGHLVDGRKVLTLNDQRLCEALTEIP